MKAGRYYPLFLDIQGKRCVVVGGGEVALRKVKMLLDFEAQVTVISPELHPELDSLTATDSIHAICRDYATGDLADARLVIAATDVKETNVKVANEARRAGALVNVVDDPERSDFIVPSFFRRGDLTIAISTAGKSPALARKIRLRLERDFGEDYSQLLLLIEEVRNELKRRHIRVRPEAWEEALDLDALLELLRANKPEKVKGALFEMLRMKGVMP